MVEEMGTRANRLERLIIEDKKLRAIRGRSVSVRAIGPWKKVVLPYKLENETLRGLEVDVTAQLNYLAKDQTYSYSGFIIEGSHVIKRTRNETLRLYQVQPYGRRRPGR